MNIAAWLRELGLERYEQAFRENEVGPDVLPKLTAEDLKEIGVIPVGDRRRLLEAIAGLAEEAEAASDTVQPPPRSGEAERRQLTVVFCDLVGSTELSAKLDPEDMGAVIRSYQTCCAEVVRRWDGHVAKYMGDGVLVYFGYPQAHEDDAERAVRAGLDLTNEVAQLTTSDGAPLAARVGIATGLVMVGDLIGEGAAQEEAVVGEVPNLAARFQALAQVGSVVIAPATRQLLGSLFELDDLGAHALKGFVEPIQAWQVKGKSTTESRFEALHPAGLTPLVGREHEIALLLERWEWAKDGDGQVVLLAGEPGIGKSRIVQTLRERLAEDVYTPLSHYCSPYHTNSPLQPIIGLLERAAGFARDDPPGHKLAKLETLLAKGTERLDEAVALIADLLSIPHPDHDRALDLSPQRKAQRTLEVLVEQVEGLAAMQPVLTVYEDVHWVDPTTLEALGLLVERARYLPVLVLITFRPEFTAPWTGHAHVTQLSLTRLARRQGGAMVARVTGGKALPDEVLDQILERTDGVPLFVEELTKTVLESGILRQVGDHYELSGPLRTLAIPSSLHDSLMARLDRLGPVKEVAQTAAVIGREFSHELLAAVPDRPMPDVTSALDRLVAAELVFRRGTAPAATYSFKHALVRDAAYESLLLSKRQQLHARIAGILDEQFPDTAPEVLAHHCTEAGLTERAVAQWRRAGNSALERSAMKEAIAHLDRGLDALADLPPGSGRDDLELDTQIALASAHIGALGYAAGETGRVYSRAAELVRKTDDDPRRFAVFHGLFVTRWNWAQLHDALAVAQEMLGEASKQPDPAPLCVAHRSVAVAKNALGDFADARRHAVAAWDLYDPKAHARSGLQYGHDIGVAALMHVALADWFLGFPEQAWHYARRGLTLAEELGHANTNGYAQFWCCWLHLMAREGALLGRAAEALVGYSDEQFMAFWRATGRAMLGAAEILQGPREAGLKLLDSGIMELESVRARWSVPFFMSARAEALVQLGRPDEGLVVLAQALKSARGSGLHWYEAELHRLDGLLRLMKKQNDQEAAEASYRRAIEVARGQAAKMWELRAATSLARLWNDQGRRANAHDLLSPIYGWFTEGFDTADLKDAKALLDELQE